MKFNLCNFCPTEPGFRCTKNQGSTQHLHLDSLNIKVTPHITVMGEEYEELGSHLVSLTVYKNGLCIAAYTSTKPKGWPSQSFD